MSDPVWVIRHGYNFEAVEFVKETTQTIFYVETWRGGRRVTRQGKGKFLDWRGPEEEARAIVQKLESARAEYRRRRLAASEWFAKRQTEIIGEREAA